MKIKITLIALLTIISIKTFSQCPIGGMTITSKADLETIKQNYPNCQNLEGDLFITGDDIETLDGLNELKSIEGNLIISNNALLANLEGLNKLEIITGYVRIQSNYALQSLEALSNLTKIKGDFFYLASSPLVTSLTGLNKLDSINGILQIWSMDELKNLSGLEKLNYIGSDCSIFKNAQIKNLSGIESLRRIEGVLRIYENAILSSLEGINAEATLGSSLVISLNPELTTCSIDALCKYMINPPGFVVFEQNDVGCNSVNEVTQNCISATDDVVRLKNVNLFPNPGNGLINLEIPYEIEEINVFDSFGKNIKNVKSSKNLDISEFRNGIYLIELKSNNYRMIKKYIKV